MFYKRVLTKLRSGALASLLDEAKATVSDEFYKMPKGQKMSKSIEKFVADVKESGELQVELKDIGSNIDKITAFANSKGYDFTSTDLKSFAKRQKAELSDDQLDKVAGGRRGESSSFSNNII